MGRIGSIGLTVIVLLLGIRFGGAQSYGSLQFGPIAPTVSGCVLSQPNNTSFCTVGASGVYTVEVSINGAAYVPLAPAASGVTSFNGRSGVVQLTKGDVTQTGIAAITTLE